MIFFHKQKKVRRWKTWSLREMEQIGQITSSCSPAAARCQMCIQPSDWSPNPYWALLLAANLTTLTSHQESINNAESPRNPEMWVKFDVRKTTTDLMIILQRNETDAWPSQALLCYKQLWTSVRSNSGKIRFECPLKGEYYFVQDSSSRSSQYLAINSDVALTGPTARKDFAPMHYFVIKYANIQKLKSITYFVHNFPNKTGCREWLPRWMRPCLRTQRELQLPVSILICLVLSQNFYKNLCDRNLFKFA